MTFARLCTTVLASFLFLGCASDRPHTPASAPATRAATKPTTAAAPFANEIAAFEALDRSPNAPTQNGIVFYGSSSIRFWKSLSADFPGLPVINRGFGGSRMDQCVMYLDRAVVPLKPRAIFVYAGDNDLAAGHSVDRVVADTHEFVYEVHRKLPQTKVYYLSIKPSPSRAQFLAKVKDANARIKAMAEKDDFTFVDVATPMLDGDGQPREELFIKDRLHMNEKGYAIWKDVIAPYVK